ncbi:MAG: hypothetical protein QOJ59_4571 [Thermomicrobiales bacterium]|jgi:deazaflavin-dependent oxidoreductase (nitroreductase family)|nr:hypothetical protein [Thermomicrobiales bacterium]
MDVPSVQNCYLETTGRVTGKAHEIEIWYAARGSTLYLLSGGGDRADWVKNLRKEPRVRVRIEGRVFIGKAAVILGTHEEQTAREAVVAKYYGWRGGPLPNDWAREALPVAVRLDGAVGD